MLRSAQSKVTLRRLMPAVRPRRAEPATPAVRRRFGLQGPSLRTSLIAAAVIGGLVAAVLPFVLTATSGKSATAGLGITKPAAAAPASAALTRPAAPFEQVGPGTPRGDSQLVTLQVGGLERSYFLLPALGMEASEEAALLVVLHQDVSSGREISVDLGLDTMRRHGVTLAYPNGYGGSWNSGSCCGIAAEKLIDDVGFVNAVIDDVGRHTPVDASRRALLGYSGGGMLAYRLLCNPHPELIAAVEIGGSLEAHCANGLALPDLLAVHGAKDGSIGLTTPRFVNHLGMAPRSVTSTLANVTGQAGCAPMSKGALGEVETWTWTGCRGGSTVEAHIVPDAGHGWADVGGAQRSLTWLLPRLARR